MSPSPCSSSIFHRASRLVSYSPQRHQFACFLQPTQQVSLTRTNKTRDSPAASLSARAFYLSVSLP